MSTQLPTRIGKYELEEFLGGGMAHVYRARDTILGRIVALKILTESGCANEETKARFLLEARMASNIVHENVIRIYDFGEEQGRPFIVMEFLRGETLREAMKQAHVGDLRSRLEIALQIATALEYIHSRKITHRDVKPENIHVDVSGRVRLVDFGIAKSEDLSLTRAGFTLGTPYYMAPEQVLGKPVTNLVDVYAFGVVLFELLAGVKPISGDTVERIFNQILYEPLNLEPLKAVGASQPVFDLISQCSAKSPADRPQGFGAISAEIQRILRLPPETPAPPPPAAKAPPPPRPSPGGMPAFVAMLPPRFRSEVALIAITATAVLGLMLLVYLLLSLRA